MIFFKQMLALLKNSCTFATAFRGVQKLMNLMEQASFAEIAQLVEHDLAKVGVASSSLVFRSRYSETFLPRWRNGRRARFRCEC